MAVQLKQTPEDPEPAIIAASIISLDASAKRMLASGLNMRCLVILISEISGVNRTEVKRVLQALPELRAEFCSKPAPKKR